MESASWITMDATAMPEAAVLKGSIFASPFGLPKRKRKKRDKRQEMKGNRESEKMFDSAQDKARHIVAARPRGRPGMVQNPRPTIEQGDAHLAGKEYHWGCIRQRWRPTALHCICETCFCGASSARPMPTKDLQQKMI